jgi:outer membrane protein OmpA-like peptidoglycan-associated protein
MPGTIGQSDLFKVSINADGSFGKPENLGNKINTEGRESFPFVSNNTILFFASDGHPGLGGFDVFSSKINSYGSFSEITNLGMPVNGSQDDFGFCINKNGKGFFTSNRSGGKGGDDIYKVTELHCKQKIEGTITDIETMQLLSQVKTTLYNDKFELLKETTSDINGNYSFEVDCSKSYYVRTELADYVTKESTSNTGNTDGTTRLEIAIEKSGCKLIIGGDLAKCFGIKVIYFDVNEAIITKEAAFELEKILDVMKQNLKIKIDVRSHTDSRQSEKKNQTLSDNRAKATMDWLVKNGVDENRLSGKGYGESQLLNKCSDGVACSEEEHQANRRSEFIVVAID